jgi:uncharacterized protein
MSGGAGRRARTVPGSLVADGSAGRVPVVASLFMLPNDMGTITVRVTPRSARPGVDVRDGRIVVRVQAPPVDGRATEEARRRLAEALGVPGSTVRLRSGAASRDKSFEVDGVDPDEATKRCKH